MNARKGLDRRGFLKASAAGLAGVGTALAAGPAAAAGQTTPAAETKVKSYRPLGRTGFKASNIGIGTSQTFPTEVLKAALEAGVNYFDTSEGYGRGQAERSIGEAIKGRDRKSLFITTRLRFDGLADTAAVTARLDQSLERLQTDYVDCLMMGPPTAASVKNEVYHQAIAELKKQGKVRFSGAGTHGARQPGQGEPMDQILLAAVEDGRFDVLLLVYNFLQKEPGERILEAASKKDIGLTIMKSNPLGRYYDTMARIEQLKKDGQPVDERLQKSMEQMAETAKQAEAFIQKNGLENPGRDQGRRPQVRPGRSPGPHAQPGLQHLRRRPEPPGPLRSRRSVRRTASCSRPTSATAGLSTAGTPAASAKPTVRAASPSTRSCATTTISRPRAARSTPWESTLPWMPRRPTPAGRARAGANRPAPTASRSGRSCAWPIAS